MSDRDWRYWLMDLPARITEISLVWYRVWFMLTLWIAALAGVVTVSMVLVLWFGFSIRWGW